jgi:peptide/nickel transport system substrate-binding protein
MRRRTVLKAGVAAGAAVMAGGGLSRPAVAQPAKVLKFVPHANLTSLDPVWTTASVTNIHANMVWDKLYGLNANLEGKPQMVAGDEVSSDGLTWKFTLRDGLMFHDGERVLAKDVVASIGRFSKRDGFGQRLAAQTDEMKALDDKTVQIRLKKPFPHMRFALALGPAFIMPERSASTDAFKSIAEYVGSGPYRFLKDEWVSGSSSGYAKFDKYVPRNEPIDAYSGGKVVNFDRVEWKVMPDPSTKASALQTGEVDWVDNPLFDLVPQLRKAAGVKVQVFDTLGVIAVVGMNHLYPPFDNKKLRQALLMAINQQDVVDAVLGDVAEFGKVGAGFFTLGTPNATTAGMEKLMGPRNIAAAKKAVAESGYKGEKIILMSPSDLASLQAIAQVTDAMFKSIGLNVEYTSMDWGTLVTRRANREPPEKGGWNSFATTWTGINFINPGNHPPLRGNGQGAWFGWPTDPKMEALRERWFEAASPAEEKAICEEIQLHAFENVPFLPMGHWFYPQGFRDTLTDIAKTVTPVFWGVKRA